MSLRRTALALGLASILAGACDPAVVPSVAPSVDQPGRSATASEPGTEPTPPVVGQLAGTWRRSPIVLDDGHVAIFSDACAAWARSDLGEDAASLPTAVVDAQGMGFAIVILADDLNGVVCQLDVDPSGGSATATRADALSGEAIAAVDGTGMTVVRYLHAADGSHTIALGRIGPDAVKAKITFDDASVIQAAKGEGWWATWWQGAVAAATFVTTDSKDIVIGHATKPPEAVEKPAGAGGSAAP